jgi:hypothetical protein
MGKEKFMKIKKNLLIISFLLLIFLLFPEVGKADVIVPHDPSKTASFDEFIGEIILNFILLRAIFYIVLNAFIAWFFVFLITKLIKSIYKTDPAGKLKKGTYFLFAFIGYFIDKVAFFATYHLLGNYSCYQTEFFKRVCKYEFNKGFGEGWVTIISGFLIFLGVSLLAYHLFSKKLYSDKKQRYLLSGMVGILVNPWWIRILRLLF